VDNDETLCELSTPPISSVALNTERLGFEGAALLDRLMRGRKGSVSGPPIAPLGVVARRSSDVLAMADPHVVAAAKYMREHLAEPIRVADVLAAAGCSRKTLEVRFKASLGRTPHEELQRLRLERVKRLLVETDWPLKRIAAQSGFTYVENLHAAFRREEGATPARWRSLHSGG
jgi:LacI family transcriptional regulator